MLYTVTALKALLTSEDPGAGVREIVEVARLFVDDMSAYGRSDRINDLFRVVRALYQQESSNAKI